MGKIQFKTLLMLSASSLLLSSLPAKADDTVKSILGGIVGSLIVEGVKEATKPREEPQQPEQIEWSEHNAGQQGTIQHQRPVQIVSDPRVREIQGYLSKTGFYKGAVDGISGAGTEGAIRAWEQEFEQVVDGQISDDELELLKEASSGGYRRYAEYKSVKDGGYARRDELLRAKIREIGSLLKDGQEFLKTYQGDADVTVIAADLKKFHALRDQDVLNGAYDGSYERVKDFFYGLDGFDEYHRSKNVERESARDNKRLDMIFDITLAKEFSGIHLRQNMMNKRAIDLSEKLQVIDISDLDSLSHTALVKQHGSVIDILKRESLFHEYERWKSEKQKGQGDDIESNNVQDGNTVQAVGVKDSATVPENPAVTAEQTKSGRTWAEFFGFGGAKAEIKREKPAQISQNVRSSNFAIDITSVSSRKYLGDGMFLSQSAPNGASYIIVQYNVRNISSAPISAWSLPSIYLRDQNGNRYAPDVNASMTYAAQGESSAKIISNLNPGISTTDFEVFEVSDQYFSHNTWQVEIDADKDFFIPIYRSTFAGVF